MLLSPGNKSIFGLQDTTAYDRTAQTGQGETMVDKLKGAVGMGPTSTTGQVSSAVLCCAKHLAAAPAVTA